MKRIFRILSMVTAGLLLAAWGTWQLSRNASYQLYGGLTDRVDTAQPRVALTFDDGPTPGHTQAILDQLDALGVRATFFLVGDAMARHPELAAQIVRAGHQVGNHSRTHSRMVFMPAAQVREELDTTDRLIREAGYTDEILFRPPYGKKLLVLPWVLHQRGTRTITWDVEPESGSGAEPPADDIVERVLEQSRPGSIILMHVMFDSRATSLQAVPGIVAGLRERGFEFVTVSELLDD
ncbi:polysaccharide deacetylase family protein [Marinihelvus fidelis]|uniref:Polysaccharide deacetylase family protein n=1 Tax=Marinihelvus fidelis TaxID=2613842 RepID=A0A5N0TFF8_9GAMM|nr:polysaccharide deacetylase family protein [Marinihelvus fidelis]KAA9131989.1 polysaccharide deacetylase family protein [Marinihelvus fidelis]